MSAVVGAAALAATAARSPTMSRGLPPLRWREALTRLIARSADAPTPLAALAAARWSARIAPMSVDAQRRRRANRLTSAAAVLYARRIARSEPIACEGIMIAAGARPGTFGGSGTMLGEVFVTGQTVESVRNRPGLIRHETRHAAQWAALGALGFGLSYLAEAQWSRRVAGNWWSMNYFERDAGLADGGYV